MEQVGDMNWADLGEDVPIGDMFARFSALLRSLKLLHSRGFNHGDLKRNNVRVQPDDPTKVWLVDFGMSRLLVDSMLNIVNVVTFSPTPEFRAEMRAYEFITDDMCRYFDHWIDRAAQEASVFY